MDDWKAFVAVFAAAFLAILAYELVGSLVNPNEG